MQRLEVSGAVRPICGSLGVKRLIQQFSKSSGLGFYLQLSLSLIIIFNISSTLPQFPSDFVLLYKNSSYVVSYFPTLSQLTLNPLTWKIWRAPNNASRWQMGLNSAFKGLNLIFITAKSSQ